MAILHYVRTRFNNKYILAFIGSKRSHEHAEASSQEVGLSCQLEKLNNLKAAELVAATLAERMKKKQMNAARFDVNAECAEKAPKFHSHIRAIAETLRKNGIKLVETQLQKKKAS